MLILSIDTSCDETSVAVTNNTTVLSNVLWSQASLHSKWGGVFPSLAKRAHEEHIDWVFEKALKTAFPKKLMPSAYSLLPNHIDAIAVTIGPGLAIALEVGIKKAKELSEKYNKPFIAVNHIEGHLLSCLAKPNTAISKSKFLISKQIPNSKSQIPNQSPVTSHQTSVTFPALSLVASGKHT